MNRIDGGGLSHEIDRSWKVILRDVVSAELPSRRRQLDAGAKIEQPSVETAADEVLGKVRVDGVNREDPARDAEAVREQHRSARTAAVPRQLEHDSVCCSEVMHLGIDIDPERTSFARRRERIKEVRPRDRAAVGVVQGAGEELPEPRGRTQPLGDARGVRHAQRGELAGEVEQLDVKPTASNDRPARVLTRTDRHEQCRRV